MIRIGLILLATSASLLMTGPAANADDANFADLLARAHAEAAAGRHVRPPGDNLTETFMAMISILPQASPQQLAEFDTLLQQQKAALTAARTEPPAEPDPPDAAAATIAATADQSPQLSPESAVPTALAKPPVEAAKLTMTEPPTASPAEPAPPGSEAKSHAAGLAAPAAAPQPAAASPLSPALAAQLFARGQAAEAAGDISGARRYFKAAAEQNNPTAAQALGQLYDPAYLRRKAIGGIDPDPAAAQLWYQRSRSLAAAAAVPTAPHSNGISAR